MRVEVDRLTNDVLNYYPKGRKDRTRPRTKWKNVLDVERQQP